ncbi:Estradiol 17 beta-dehydrogenase 5 [Eumeta japonica]|uniref:Estradiol 17 beta-dehydrogenase 5 n=1 Tax=Eumeta variegata TaxID=151549 RepID=A0A4C1ZQS6_EUMVA|nr:Estradiol 17 beta-dehydrogenase 5 [Eumeta japonica]
MSTTPNGLYHAPPVMKQDVYMTLPRQLKQSIPSPTRVPDVVLVAKASAVVPDVTLNDGHKMPALGLGTWLGYNAQGVRERPKASEVQEAVTWALDAGYRHIDTAYIYRVEDQVGRALTDKFKNSNLTRQDIFVTTKLWNDFHGEDQVIPALQESLRNLNLDYVDLYLIHWPVGQYANGTFDARDFVDTWRGMEAAQRAGLTRSIGLSNFNRDQIDRILAVAEIKPAALQVEHKKWASSAGQIPTFTEYAREVAAFAVSFLSVRESLGGLFTPSTLPLIRLTSIRYPIRSQEAINLNLQQPDLVAYCKQKGIVVVGYTPFGSLFYSRAREDAPPPRADDPQLVAIAGKYGKTVPQLALRYLVEIGVVPIPKSVAKERIEQNIDVFDFQLTEEERQVLKSFDRNYRVLPQLKWKDHPYYPF